MKKGWQMTCKFLHRTRFQTRRFSTPRLATKSAILIRWCILLISQDHWFLWSSAILAGGPKFPVGPVPGALPLFRALGARVTFLSARPPIWEGQTRLANGCVWRLGTHFSGNCPNNSWGLLVDLNSNFPFVGCCHRRLLDDIGIAEAVVLLLDCNGVIWVCWILLVCLGDNWNLQLLQSI